MFGDMIEVSKAGAGLSIVGERRCNRTAQQ